MTDALISWLLTCAALSVLSVALLGGRWAQGPWRWLPPALLLTGPLALLLAWGQRQRTAWHSAYIHPTLWLHEPEPRSRVPWRHRRVFRVLGLHLLVRPRPTLDWPVLVAPGRLILTPLLFQLQVLWAARFPAPPLPPTAGAGHGR